MRELTKIYEEYTRGSISELVAFLEENPLKGECLLIVEGAKEEELDLEAVSYTHLGFYLEVEPTKWIVLCSIVCYYRPLYA